MRLTAFLILSLCLVAGCLLDKSGDIIILPHSESPWHTGIEATIFNIFASSEKGVTAFNDLDAFTENPYHVALPFNPATYRGSTQGIPDSVKNLWVQLVNPANGATCYAQWEDVGPWFVDDWEYVFSADGSIRPSAEKKYGTEHGIYLHRSNSTERKIKNKAGVDMSPAVASFLGINGKGTAHWRFVQADAVPSGPWYERVSTTPPHYRKNAPLRWVSNHE